MHSRFTTMIAGAAMLGFTVSGGVPASAGVTLPDPNLLENPGAEANECSTDGWNVSDPSVVQGVTTQTQTAPAVSPQSGDCFFTMAAAATADGGVPPTESMDQDVDIAGCSFFGLGTWAASGYIQTEEHDQSPTGEDFGELNIRFFDDGDSQVGNTEGLDDLDSDGNAWEQFSDDGNIPEGAVTANFELLGSLDDGTFINVFYDTLSFETDCVLDAAKIGGGKEHGNGNARGRGKSMPLFAFDGAVGNLEEEGLVGAVAINYRDDVFGPTTCTFTPTEDGITYVDDPLAAVFDATYECEGGLKDEDTGDAVIWLFAKGVAGCDSASNPGGKDKNRGAIRVWVPGDEDLNIDDIDAEDYAAPRDANCLETGNVEIVPPVNGI